MFRRKKTDQVKSNVAAGADIAAALATDKKFRKQLLSAIGHAELARRRARDRVGVVAAGRRLATDEELRRDVAIAVENLRQAWARIDKQRDRGPRKKKLFFITTVGGIAAMAWPTSRRWLTQRVSRTAPSFTSPRVISETIDVEVPISTAYNQWTQFEDFPLFMDGVEHVQQLDDTRLRWVAKVGGRTAEWDAKILEQDPDRQISWISEDGRKTRGTVTFEPLSDQRTLVGLSMSYQAEGPAEAIGSMVGLDARRVRGDLERFKDLIETRGDESGAWRGTISAGTTE
jgi:uncharacterized membrane protein